MANKWWVIHEDALLEAIERAYDPGGDTPALIMMELVANSRVEEVPPDAEPEA